MAAARAFDVLRGLFGVVTVTAIVRDEVLAGGDRPGAAELQEAIDGGWVEVVRADPDPVAFADLDAGESSTLSLARAHRGRCLLVMDEPLGRAHARALGLTVTGVAGVLLAARQRGLIDAVRPLLDALASNGFRLSREVVGVVLKEAGEE